VVTMIPLLVYSYDVRRYTYVVRYVKREEM
jgi:hypothetical protein